MKLKSFSLCQISSYRHRRVSDRQLWLIIVKICQKELASVLPVARWLVAELQKQGCIYGVGAMVSQ